MATLIPFGSQTPLPSEYSKAVIDAIAARMAVPNPLVFGAYGMRYRRSGFDPKEPQQLYPSFSSEFLVTFRADGSLKKLSITQKSLSPAIDNAIASAIRAAEAARAFPPIAQATNEKELSVFIDLDFADCEACVRSWLIFGATVPLYLASRNVSQILPLLSPKYPEDLRRRRTEGNVSVRFVVDESGRVADGAYRFINISEVDFGKEVLHILPRLRYEPARIGNCKVKQLVQQTFNFRLFY